MHEESVEFFSEGTRVSGLLRTAEGGAAGPRPAIVQGPGWLGLKDAKLYVRYHEALTEAGFAVLIFDYRGFGDSEGDRGVLLARRGSSQDLVNAVTYLTTRDDVDADAIGAFGTGGTGGGNAVLLAGVDAARQGGGQPGARSPTARDWLHRMRPEHEWLAFLERLEEDRRQRVLTGTGRLVAPARGDHGADPRAAHHHGQGRRRRPDPERRSRWPRPRRSSPTGRSRRRPHR